MRLRRPSLPDATAVGRGSRHEGVVQLTVGLARSYGPQTRCRVPSELSVCLLGKSPLRHHLTSTKVLVSVRFGRRSIGPKSPFVRDLSSPLDAARWVSRLAVPDIVDRAGPCSSNLRSHGASSGFVGIPVGAERRDRRTNRPSGLSCLRLWRGVQVPKVGVELAEVGVRHVDDWLVHERVNVNVLGRHQHHRVQ